MSYICNFIEIPLFGDTILSPINSVGGVDPPLPPEAAVRGWRKSGASGSGFATATELLAPVCPIFGYSSVWHAESRSDIRTLT